MTKLIPIWLCAVGPVLAADGGMTTAERAYLLEQLATSKKAMLASIEGLSADQWAFKPAPELNLMPGRTLNVMVLLSGLTVQLCTAPPSSFFRSSAS